MTAEIPSFAVSQTLDDRVVYVLALLFCELESVDERCDSAIVEPSR